MPLWRQPAKAQSKTLVKVGERLQKWCEKLGLLCMVAVLLLSGMPAASAAETASPPALSAGGACLMDAQTGQILFEKDMDKQCYPASITKIMTILLGVENGNWSDTVTMTDASVLSVPRNTSHLALTPGEQLTLEQALMGAMLPSANDAANGVAETIGGTIENFVSMMNARAAALGATNTHFANANGLDDDTHVTTAHDMALITKAALQNPDFVRVFSTAEYTIPATNKQVEARNIGAGNKMMFDFTKYYYPGIIGGKSGYTEKAGHTLVSAAERDGRKLISVVMAEPSNSAMYVDSVALLDYGFNSFTQVSYTAEQIAADIKANGATLVSSDPVTLLLANGMQQDSLQKTYSIESSAQYGMQVQVNLTLADAAGVQYATVATAQLKYALPLGEGTVQLPTAVPVWQTVLQWAGIALGCAAAVFVLLLLAVRLRYDLRRLRRKRLRAKALAAGATGRVRVQPGGRPVQQDSKRKSV